MLHACLPFDTRSKVNFGFHSLTALIPMNDPSVPLGYIYLLTAIGLTPGGSSTVHIYTQTVHRTKQLIWEECGPCPVFASCTLAFDLELRERHGKTSVRVREECQLARWKQNIQKKHT